MSYQEIIEEKLHKAFTPEYILVRDESAQHAGHAGARPGGETHFHVEIRANAFAGLSRIARQRLVYQVLDKEMEEQIHALSLKVEASED